MHLAGFPLWLTSLIFITKFTQQFNNSNILVHLCYQYTVSISEQTPCCTCISQDIVVHSEALRLDQRLRSHHSIFPLTHKLSVDDEILHTGIAADVPMPFITNFTKQFNNSNILLQLCCQYTVSFSEQTPCCTCISVPAHLVPPPYVHSLHAVKHLATLYEDIIVHSEAL